MNNILFKFSFLLFLITCTAPLLYANHQKPAEKCQQNVNCKLPYCNCESNRIPISLPKNLKLFEMPQLVVLTIDDDKLDINSYQIYKKLFENFKNPNNASIRATIFLSDSENRISFCLLRNLYEKRHEIAISTVNFTCPNKRCSTLKNFQSWDYVEWTDQILNMRERLNRYAGIPISEIVGFRAPLLEPASDMHFRIIAGNKFLYDSSLIINSDSDELLYPFTLNYKVKTPLQNNGPIKTYPGLWEFPIPTYIDVDNKREKCLKLWEGHCKYDKSENGIAKFLRHHFLRAYYNNRAPILLHLNADWLKEYVTTKTVEIMPNVGYANKQKAKIEVEKREYHNLNGLMRFINLTLANNKDVYFVTAKKVIEWMSLMNRVSYNNLTSLIENDLFDDFYVPNEVYDGECPILSHTLDYDKEDLIILDDTFGDELRKKLKIERGGESILVDLQSEVLFMNDVVLYFLAMLALVLLIIIVRDHYF